MTYVITGATSGIGKALATALDEYGYQLILISRSGDKLKDFAGRLKGKHECLPIDLTDLESLISTLQNRKDKIKGFVHCAGMESVTPIRQVSYAKFDYLMKLHLYSFIEIVKYIERNKMPTDEYLTNVVVISSIASQVGGAGQTMYSASKSAVESAVRVLSKELVGKKIRFNSILPGIVNTEMTERWKKKVGINDLNDLNKLQLSGIAQTSDIVALIQFLLSDVSKQIVGTEIKIDGGGPLNKFF